MIRFFKRRLRSKAGARFLGWYFTHMTFTLPVHRLRETSTLIAFDHPRPAYPVHILIIPRRAYTSLMDVPTADAAFWSDLTLTVQSLVREFRLEQAGYRLITNGGPYQEVPQLHFHLVSGDPIDFSQEEP